GTDVRLEAKTSKIAPVVVKTDSSGKYRFPNVPQGVYKVTVLSGSAIQGFVDNVRTGAGMRRVDFDIKPAMAGKAKTAKHLVWVPEATGSHLGGHWVEVDDSGAAAGSERVEKKSGQALRSLQSHDGN